MKVLDKLLIVLFNICLIIVAIWISAVPIAKSKSYYQKQFTKNEIYAHYEDDELVQTKFYYIGGTIYNTTYFTDEQLDTIIEHIIDYLFKGKRKFYREFMSGKIKSKLGLSDKEYKKLYPEIANKSITDLDKSHPKVATAIREIFDSMEIHKRKHGRNYNEWLVSRPKIQGVFVSGQQYEHRTHNIPKFLAKYANDNDLPVIMFCD